MSDDEFKDILQSQGIYYDKSQMVIKKELMKSGKREELERNWNKIIEISKARFDDETYLLDHLIKITDNAMWIKIPSPDPEY